MINEGINILDDFGWNLGRMGEIMVINFVRPFKKGVNDIIDGLNQLISGYNSTVGVFGSGLTMPLISRLYSGTQNFQGGFANINDLGKNEGLSLPSAGGGFVTYLPQNTKVYSGSTTERMTSNNDSNIQYVISLKDITTPMILEFFRLNLLQFKKLGFEIKN
jgi:phage-related protein